MIYFITDGAFDETRSCVKVGFSKNGGKVRMYELQVGNPNELKLIGQMAGDEVLEKHIHGLLSSFYVRGEWFRYNEESNDLLVEFFSSIRGWHDTAPDYETYRQWVLDWKPGIPQGEIEKYLKECCVGGI